jgi:DNA-binding NarL/FixJ family response regulator
MGNTAEKKIRIVVADDHPIFRDALCRLLGQEDDFVIVAQAQDGHEVLQILHEHAADILLLDLKMPNMDGLATLQRLQVSRNRTKVIVLTASEDKNDFVQAVKFGTSGILLKQTATELLIKSIRKVYAGEIWLDSNTTAVVMRQFSSLEDPSAPLSPPSGRARERLSLSQREREIVSLVEQGFRNKETAGSRTQSTKHSHRNLAKFRMLLKTSGRNDGGSGSGTPLPAYARPRLEDCPTRARKPLINRDLKQRYN